MLGDPPGVGGALDERERAAEEVARLVAPLRDQVLRDDEQGGGLDAEALQRDRQGHHAQRLAEALLPREQLVALDQGAGEVLELEVLVGPADAALGQRPVVARQAEVALDAAQHLAHRLDVLGIQRREVAGVGHIEVLEDVRDLLGLLVKRERPDGDLQQLALVAPATLLRDARAVVDDRDARVLFDLGLDRERVALASEVAALCVTGDAEDRVEVVQVAQPLLRLDRVVGHQRAARAGDDALNARL